MIEDEYPGSFDVIFCRNVVIYFDLETTINVVHKMHKSLLDDGFYFIGYSESLQFLRDKFEMQSWSDAIYYRKTRKDTGTITQETQGKDESLRLEAVLEEISRAEAIAELEKETKGSAPPKKMEDLLVEIITGIHMKQYSKALELIEEACRIDSHCIEPHFLAAEVYANQGKFILAQERLNRILLKHPLFAPAHYLYGFILMEENQYENAKAYLKKSFFLNKDFMLPRFYLAQVYRIETNVESAIKEYRNTLKLLSKHVPEAIIPYSGGFNVATFMSMCRDNLERLKEQQ